MSTYTKLSRTMHQPVEKVTRKAHHVDGPDGPWHAKGSKGKLWYTAAMKAAILLIDLLEDYFQDGRLKANRSPLVSQINALTSVGRASHIPIIWVSQAFKADLSDAFVWMRKTQTAVTIENTPGSQLLHDLERDPTDLEVVKKRYSAFFRTNLDELLQTLAADLLIIGGINTHACVRMAVIDAYQRDYEVVLALDCTDSYDEEHHHISVRYLTRGICTGKTNPDLFDLLTSHPLLFFGDSGGLEAHGTQARSVG